jgi:hypothetical protein
MHQIGSLSRITSFVNAYKRVRIIESLEGIDQNYNLMYIDQNYLITRNRAL